MAENIPINEIPLPQYENYKRELCEKYDLVLPLKGVPFSANGNLRTIPSPLDKERKGWPWCVESDIKFSNETEYPKVSVVIPSYQQGLYLEEALRSVLLQNYPNLELIVIDGGSTDATCAILEYYKEYISFSVSAIDRGQSHALNMGFSIASGDFYYWLNSDDYINRNSLNHVIPCFIKQKNLSIVYGHGISVEELSGKVKFEYAPFVLERYLRFGGIVLSHSIIWKATEHCAIWEDLNCAMDAELWLRLFPDRKAKHLRIPIGIFRKHPAQKTDASSAWGKKWTEDYENYIWQYYPAIKPGIWRLRSLEYRFFQCIYRLIHPAKDAGYLNETLNGRSQFNKYRI